MKTKGTLRRVLSLFLALVLALSTVSTAVAGKEKLNLVSFGDSMTNGYGHECYYEEWDDKEGVHHSVQVNGFLQNDVTTTYPYYLKDALSSTYNVNWTALAVSCMRTEDVNFLLRYHTADDAWNTLAQKLDDTTSEGNYGSSTVENWNNSAKAAWESTFIDDGNVIGDYFTWNEFVQGRFWNWKNKTNSGFWESNPTRAYAGVYQDYVKNADVITLGTGNANFGVIMLQNITSLLTEQKDEEGNWKAAFGSGFKDAVSAREVLQNRLPAEIVPTALDVLDMVDEKVAPYLSSLGNVRDTQDSKAAKVLEIVEHTTVSFMFSYMDMLYAIDELNDKDNLDVIMMGLMNTMDGVKIDLGDGQIFDLGAVVDGITDVLSAYYFILPVALQELNGDFENITFYIVPNDDHIEMQVSDMASLEKIKASNTIRERMIQEVSGMIFDLVRGEGTQENPGLNGALKAGLGNDAPQLPEWSMNDNTAYQYREKVEAYEALQKSYKTWVDGGYEGNWTPPMNSATAALLGAPNDMLACAVYLAFERAIIANADNATLDLAGLMSLMGGTEGLAGMMTPIAGSLTTALGEDAQAAIFEKVANAFFSALLSGDKPKAQLNTPEIVQNISEIITQIDAAIGITQDEATKVSLNSLKATYETFKDSPIVPAKSFWYNTKKIPSSSEDVANAVTRFTSFAEEIAPYKGSGAEATQKMFTVIELTNALNGALGGALENASSLGGLLSLYARMIIGNGIGSHPTADGHKTLFNEIMEVYPDKPAKAFLEEVVKDTAEELYQLAKSGNIEALNKIVALALEQGLIDEAQAELIKAQLPQIYVAVYEQDDEAIMNSCKKLAVLLYDYGRENGYINDEIHAIVTEAIRVYTDVKDMDEDEIIEYAKNYITTLLDEHGTEILDAIKLFAIEQGWVTENEISACTAKIDAVKAAVESQNAESIASAVKDLAVFLAEVYKAKEPALEALKDQFAELYTKLQWFATPRKAGPYTNIVTIGASNVNGYGLRGYLKPTGDYTDDTVMEAAALNSALKSGANVLGYNQAPAGSYPALLRKAISDQQGNTVKLDQLAISSMRAEELRILLDNDYNGDAYSAWRFIGNGKWFDIADGNPNGDFSQLRSEYQTAVKNADLITVDIGANNFGVYLSQMLTNGFKFDNDLSLVDPQIGKLYNDAKAEVNKLLAEYGISVQDYAELADTLVYALVGFCYNFDKSMESILELNPDATVVVVSIQNLMAGLKAKFGGIEVPFGDMMGALVNTANAYIHYASPFAAKYLYTDVAGDAGRVEFFIDKMAAYDGNIKTIDKNIIDCFNVYDGNPKDSYDKGFHVKYLLNKKTSGSYTDEQLNKVYDAYAQILSACAKINTLDLATLDQLDNFKSIQSALEAAIETAITTAATSTDPYTLPANFFSDIANSCGVSESVVKTVAAMAVRTDIGNSFFSHPTPAGHVTVADKILNTLNYEKTGLDWLYENINNLDEKLYELVKEYGPEALAYIEDYAVEQGWVTAEQIALIEREVNAAIDAYNNKDYDALYANCKAVAAYLYEEACNNGYVPKEVQEAIAKAIELYDELKDKTPDELKAYAKEQLKALAEEYGPEALEKLNEYVLSLKVLNAQQLAELETKIWDFINAYPDAPDATVDAAIDELVDFLFEITELDKDKVMEMYEYLTTTSKEQMLADAAELMQEYLDKYGPKALEYVENYLIAEGYVTADEIAEITKQVKLAMAAYEADDKAAMKASCEKLAKLIYAYADAKGYIPAEVKEALAKAMELYKKYGDMTPEQIKALAAAELKKFVAEHKAEALIALHTFITDQGWCDDINDAKALAEKISAVIAAYEADPEGTAEKMVTELVDYLYELAVAEGYIDPAKVAELDKLADMVKCACDYFANTSEEQLKADAIALLFAELDQLTDGKVNAEVYAQVKQDVANLIVKLDELSKVTPAVARNCVMQYINSVKEAYDALIDDATHGEYVSNGESYYVALGGDTVYGTGIGKYDDGYYDLLLEELDLNAKTQYKNLGEQNIDLTKLLAYIEKNADAIKKADLITYQMDATAFILAALNEEDPDWSRYFTEEELAFVEEALPVIQKILEDDWTKYADIDVEQLTDELTQQVFAAISKPVMKMFKHQDAKLKDLLKICIGQVKNYVAFAQEQAQEAAGYVDKGDAAVNKYFKLVEEKLAENWADYVGREANDIVNGVMAEVTPQLGEYSDETYAELVEFVTACAKEIAALHEHVAEKLNAVPAQLSEYFNEDQLTAAGAVYDLVVSYIPQEYTNIDAEAIHQQVYAYIVAKAAEGEEALASFLDFGEEYVNDVLTRCVKLAVEAASAAKSQTKDAVAALEEAYGKLENMVLPVVKNVLIEDWTKYVDMTAEAIVSEIQGAVLTELAKQGEAAQAYVDQYTNELNAVLTVCVDEVKSVLTTAQDKKDEIKDAVDAFKPFAPYAEKILYASVAFTVDTAKAVDAIQEINPDATLIVVGMYNPLNGLEVIMNDETIDVGAYMEYLIDATNIYYTALAVADGGFTFVAVPDTTINGFENAIDVNALDISKLGSMLLKLNDSMYADADGHKYIFEQIMGALAVPKVDNKTKETTAGFDAKVSFEDKNKTAVVECEKDCVVLARLADGSYVRLNAVKRANDSYEFDLSGVEGQFTLTVALKGDYNLDGTVTTNDVAKANKALVNHTDPSELQNYVFDMTGDDAITTNDVAKVNKSLVSKTAIEW